MVAMRDVENPRSTFCMLHSVRSSRPAPASSTNASATSAAISTLRVRRLAPARLRARPRAGCRPRRAARPAARERSRQQRGHDGDRQREQHHPRVDRDRVRSRNAVAADGDEQPGRPVGEHQPERAADRREHQRLGDDLPDETAACAPSAVLIASSFRRAAVRPSIRLPRLAQAISSTKPTDASRTTSDRSMSPDELTVERDDVDAEALVRRIGLFEARRDPGHLGLRLLHRDARLQPADDRQPERAARVARPLVGRQRLPELAPRRHLQGAGMTPMISNARPLRVIVLPSTSAAPPNLPLPQAVREQDDAIVAGGFVGLGVEAPEQRANAHHVEEVRRGLGALAGVPVRRRR